MACSVTFGQRDGLFEGLQLGSGFGVFGCQFFAVSTPGGVELDQNKFLGNDFLDVVVGYNLDALFFENFCEGESGDQGQ